MLLGLRADDVYQHPQPEHGTVTGMVETIELTGRYAVIGLRVEDQLLNARFDRRTRVRPGDMVTVGIDAARAHVFDPITKKGPGPSAAGLIRHGQATFSNPAIASRSWSGVSI